MFKSQPMTSIEKQIKTKRFLAKNKKLRKAIYKFYSLAAVSLFTLIMVSGVVIALKGIIYHQEPINAVYAQIEAKNEVSMEQWVFDTLESELGLQDAIKGVGIVSCESNWREDIGIIEPNNTISYGLWQINSIHKDITNANKLDYKEATKWAIEKRKEDGNWSAWTCGR